MGEVRFNDYMYQMIEKTMDVLPTAKRAVVLGVGLGGIPQILVELVDDITVDAVDLDEEIFDVAEEAFCYPRHHKRINSILADGVEHIANSEPNTYDIVFIDIFDGFNIPNAVKTKEFFKSISRAMKPHGIVTSNTLRKDTEYLHNIQPFF